MSIARIRQSQIISTYGPGALVDLPDTAVLVAGLEQWKGEAQLIPEPRLLESIRYRYHMPASLELRAPPAPEREDQLGVGVVAYQFPEWHVAQYEVSTREHGRSRPLVHRQGLVRGRYTADDPTGKRKHKDWPVVPIRFVQACPNGHVSDIDWHRVVHGDGVGCGGQLWLDERGTTGDLADLSVRCDGCERPSVPLLMLQSTREERSVLGNCRGERPWLGPAAREECRGPDGKPHRNKLLIRHASNAYFPIIERAISIPDQSDRLRKAVDALWDDFLSVAESATDVKRERRKQRVAQTLEGFSDAEVWAECERRQSGAALMQKSLKDVELDTFLAARPDVLGDAPEGDFLAREWKLDAARTGPIAAVSKLVLAHRLREVVAQVGFTRFESTGMPIESDFDLPVQMASLAMEPRWLPAVENRGEGVFLALDPGKVKEWADLPAIKRRAAEFQRGIQSTSKSPVTIERILQIHMPYIMLHSLSHLLLTAIALECGYSAASIRERIYVRDGAYGILLYTGTPDAEGTLGGLVQVGRRLERHLLAALELGRLCSNDPVCAQHRPNRALEDRITLGAACHGCLLIAEPSCERRNELLDRSLVVPTLDQEDAAFFRDAP